MAHEIFGDNMVYFGEVPWHGIGKPLDGTETGNDIKDKLDLSEIVLRPVFTLDNKNEMTEVPNKFATVRVKDNRPLGIVGDDYQPVQDTDVIDTLDKLRAEGLVRFNTAGLLRDASRFWCMMDIPGGKFQLKTPNGKIDESVNYLLAAHSHDGTLAMTIIPTTVRVVCANTLSFAMQENAARRKKNKGAGAGVAAGYYIKHTKNAEERVAAAVESYRQSIHYFDVVQRQAQQLIQTPFNDGQMKQLTAAIFPVAEERETDIPAQTLKSRWEVERLFVEGAGHQELALTGTAWGAFNAVTEYLDYNRPTRGIDKTNNAEMTERRMTNAWFSGPVVTKKLEAISHISRIAEIEMVS